MDKDITRDKDANPDKHFELAEVLLAELRHLKGEEWVADHYEPPKDDSKERKRQSVISLLHKSESVALCLSGGGIRSATFNLGVLQALARNGVLKGVDYLSTVSGGGYIGSWLSSWISREEETAPGGFDRVVATLAQETGDTRCNEPYQVRFLRDYSNYLTPRVGILSTDTWAIIGTYLRNLLLNWLVLLPLFFACLLLPRILSSLISGADGCAAASTIFLAALTGLILHKYEKKKWPLKILLLFLLIVAAGSAFVGCRLYIARHSSLILLVEGAILGVIPIAYTVVDLPSIGNKKQGKRDFAFLFLGPLVLMACALSAYWGMVYGPGCAGGPALWQFWCYGVAVHLGGWLAGFLTLRGKDNLTPWQRLFVSACAVITGIVAGSLGWAAATEVIPSLLKSIWYPKLLYATLSVPTIFAVYLLTGALLVALLSRCTGEQDREWWGRSGGVVILAALSWGAIMALVIYGPWLLLPDSSTLWHKAYLAVGGASGIAAALMGKASSTPATRPSASMSKLRTQLPAAVAGVFLLFLAQLISLLTTIYLWQSHYVFPLSIPCLPDSLTSCPPLPALSSAVIGVTFRTHLYMLCSSSPGPLAAIALGSAGVSLFMSVFVNINKFSLHAMYRNRLVRCYLGASRKEEARAPNLFTGFDEKDNLPMLSLPKRPLHVVNIAWNLVKGRRLSWQQRKAASFIITPLFAGSDIAPPRTDEVVTAKGIDEPRNVAAQHDSGDSGKDACGNIIDATHKGSCRPGGYRDIREYGAYEAYGKWWKFRWEIRTPLTLGTAMAISGAAASPNMGYHSSPLVTFVMAFFNVRLGWWLGNPGEGMGDAWRKSSPRVSMRPLLKETLGLTNEENADIYLSDGGHFENLGLYEMVRRRCRRIIVCDAGCDCGYTFEDLGNAVRKVRADFGIEIDIDVTAIRKKKTHCAVGTVRYSLCDDPDVEDGVILYLKPAMTGDEPIDDFNYAKTHPEFPHETTADQWFDEAQFESYRMLGFHSVEGMYSADELRDGWPKMTLSHFFDKAAGCHQAQLKLLKEKRSPARKE